MIVLNMGTRQAGDSIPTALFGKVRLSLLYGQPDRKFYLNELVRLAGVGRGAIQRELERLVGVGLLTREKQGNHVYFRANADAPVFEELRSLIHKTVGVTHQLRDALAPLEDRIE